MMMTDEQQLSEVEALRKDWYERVFNTIEKLDGNVSALSKEIGDLRDELKEYSKTGDEKLEEKLRNKIDGLAIKLDGDKKTENTEKNKNRRQMIGLLVVVGLTLLTTIGGYFATTLITVARVDNVKESYTQIKKWKDSKNDVIVKTSEKATNNEDKIHHLREEFNKYFDKEKGLGK